MPALAMRKHNGPGILITFCGLDGCGKTTMIRHLSQWMEEKGYCLFLTRQPTDFVRQSQIFRTYMDSPDHDAFDYRSLSLLAASDRVQHCSKVILPQLRSGKTVVSDRYLYSCAANLRARGYTGDRWIYEIARWIVKPDLAFFLDVPVEIAVQRVRSRAAERERYIDIPLQYRLRDEYLRIAEDNGGIVLSSLMAEEMLLEKIKRIAAGYLEVRYGH